MARRSNADRRYASGLAAVLLMAATAGVAQSFGRFTFGAVLPAVRNDLDLSNTVAGSLATANVGSYLLGTLVVAVASARWRLKPIMHIGFVFALLGLGLAAIAPNVWVLGLAMIASGFGGALVWIPAPVIAADSMPPERRSLAVGLLGTGMGLGIVFAGQLSSWVRSSSGDEAWRTVYVVIFVVSVVALAGAYWFVDHAQERPSGASRGIGGFSALRRMGGWLPLTAAYTAFGFQYLLVLAFLTARLEDDSGWSSSLASLAFTLVGLAVIFGSPLSTMLSDRFGPRKSLSAYFVMWIVMIALIIPGWAPVTLPSSFGIGLIFAGIPTMITLYVVQNTSVEDYGAAFAAATLAFGVAQIVGPQVGGIIADGTGSFFWVFMLSGAVGALGLVAASRLPSQR